MRKLLLMAGICLPLWSWALPSWALPSAVGEKAPTFTMKTLEGTSIDSQQLQGNKPVYLKFWATWCLYCKEEMPHLQATYENLADKVEVVAVNVGLNDSIANIQRLFQSKGYSLPVVFDDDGELTARFDVFGTPTHVLIDRDGRVIYRSHLVDDTLERHLKAWQEQ